MTTQRSHSASRTRTTGGRTVAGAMLIAAAAIASTLGGCGTVGVSNVSPTTEAEDKALAASPANIASLSGVVQNNPKDPQAYNMRGSVLGGAGHQDQALADFNKAISLDPNYAQAYANRALVYRDAGKFDLALAD